MPGASLRNFLPRTKRFFLQESAGYLKQSPLEKIRLHTTRQDLARGLVMARSGIPIPPEMSFYPVFRQTPGLHAFDTYSQDMLD